MDEQVKAFVLGSMNTALSILTQKTINHGEYLLITGTLREGIRVLENESMRGLSIRGDGRVKP